MPSSPQDDIQIKSSGTSAASSASQSAPVVQNPVAVVEPVVIPTASIQLEPTSTSASTPNPTKPTNQRAFNLEADADQSTTLAKPEKYAIPKAVIEKYPELVELVKTTESMDDEEREYWFQIMPVMTAEQVEKFKGILQTEKTQLADLDKEYENELGRLNEKHLLEWKEFETKEKSKAIKEAEAASSVEEKQMEEDLLAKLGDV